MRLKLRIIAFLLVLTSCVSQSGDIPNVDFTRGQKAYASYEIADAEMYFQRFLRKNPSAPERWDVWRKLLNISLNIRQEKVTAVAYLEIMLEEFGNDNKRRLGIELELAEVYHALRNENRAVKLWERILNDPGTPLEEKAKVYQNLSHAYLSRMEFALAENMLQSCLELDVNTSTKSDCLYDLAEEQVLTEKLPLAAISLRTLLAMNGVADEMMVLADFMLGDVLEQQGKYEEALKQFIKIRYNFPNSQVMEKRIAFLEKKQKAFKK